MSRIISENQECGFNAQLQEKINDLPTEFVFHAFANKWFLFITQYEKMPNLFEVKFDLTPGGGGEGGRGGAGGDPLAELMQRPINDPKFHQSLPISIKCLLGVDDLEVRSAITHLMNHSKLSRCPTEILLSIGLKKINGAILRSIVEILDKIIT